MHLSGIPDFNFISPQNHMRATMLIQPHVARNTSESREICQFGLGLKRGDKVLTTNCSAVEGALRSGIGSFGK